MLIKKQTNSWNKKRNWNLENLYYLPVISNYLNKWRRFQTWSL